MSSSQVGPRSRSHTDARAVLLHPRRLTLLRELGSRLPYKSITEILGRGISSVAVYSDYSGDSANSQFLTYAAYVADFKSQAVVVSGIDHLRRQRGILNRTLQFKNRKDSLKHRLARPWLAQFRRWPGLLVIWCVEKAAQQKAWDEAKAERLVFADDLLTAGLALKLTMVDRIANAVCPLGLIGHLLGSEMKLLWMSDRDPIFDGANRDHTMTVFDSLIQEIVTTRLAHVGVVTCPPNVNEPTPQWELLLSLPDLAAGAIATSLKTTKSGCFAVLYPDDQTREIIEGLATFADASIADSSTPCRLLLAATFINPVTGEIESNLLSLNNTSSG